MKVTDLLRASRNILNILSAVWMHFHKSMWCIMIKWIEHCTLSFIFKKLICPEYTIHPKWTMREEKEREEKGKIPICPNYSRQG